jgi:hypothetical protein
VPVADEGVVEVAELLADLFVLDADDDAVGLVEVRDRVALFQELGVVGDLEGHGGRRSRIRSLTASVVPTGTVDFMTTVLGVWVGAQFLDHVGDVVGGAVDVLRLVCPRSSLGVPTQMKTMSASR